VGRSLEIFGGLGSFGAVVLMDKLTGNLENKMSTRAKDFRIRLTQLGPTFVKGNRHLGK
jgi:hypothetical protein